MKIIFLDIDGVLNRIGVRARTQTRWGGYIGMEPELVERFNDICQKTGAVVVLSSAWRNADDWLATMKANGLTCEFIDRTPNLNSGNSSTGRGLEVKAWLDKFTITDLLLPENEQVEKYCCIDDDSDFLPYQNLFKTNYEDGLTAEQAKLIIEFLNAKTAL